MNSLNLFIDFYNDLSADGLFFFWICVFLFCFLIFLCVVLLVKNNNLMKLLKEERYQKNDATVSESNSEVIPLQVQEETVNVVEEKKEEELPKEEVKEEPKGPYSKNVLREMNTRMQTSPIHIERETSNVFDKNPLQLEVNLDDDVDNNLSDDIVNKIQNEYQSSNIELTDYERKQEEEAIISCQELLKTRDKIYNITEEGETNEFIDELKSLRSDLK